MYKYLLVCWFFFVFLDTFCDLDTRQFACVFSGRSMGSFAPGLFHVYRMGRINSGMGRKYNRFQHGRFRYFESIMIRTFFVVQTILSIIESWNSNFLRYSNNITSTICNKIFP